MRVSRNGMIASGALLVVTLAVIFSGCAVFNSMVKNDALMMQLATEAATARVLNEHPEWRSDTISITDAAVTMIDAKTVTDLKSVEWYIKSKIEWQNMLPEEQALVSTLISEVRRNIEDSLRAQDIKAPELQMVEVRQVLTWINETAKRGIKS